MFIPINKNMKKKATAAPYISGHPRRRVESSAERRGAMSRGSAERQTGLAGATGPCGKPWD